MPTAPLTESVNLLLMDALNTPMADQMYVHKQMVKYLATIPPGTRLGIFMLSDRLRLVQGFTSDTSILRAAIASSAANPNQSALLETPAETALHQTAVGQVASTGPPTGPTREQAAAAAAIQQFQSSQAEFAWNGRMGNTLEAFQQIARYLAGVPGRKNLIWLSGSFPLCILSDTACPYQQRVVETLNMLAKARVSIYPIAASGLAPDALYDASAPPNHDLDANLIAGKPAARVAKEAEVGSLLTGSMERISNQNAMDALAYNTGGKAIYNANDLRGAIECDIQDGASFYTLAYTPTNHSEIGESRNIAVQLASGKYNLAYRRSYYEDTPKTLRAAGNAPAKDPLHPFMDRGMPDFTELSYSIRIVPLAVVPTAGAQPAGDNTQLQGPRTRHRMTFMLGIDGVDLAPSTDGKRRGRVEVALVAYSPQGKPLNWEVRNIDLSLTPQELDAARATGIPFDLEFDVPNGDVYLRTGVYDLASRKAGTLEIPMSAVTIATQATMAAEAEKPKPPQPKTAPPRPAPAPDPIAAKPAPPATASLAQKAHKAAVVFWQLSPARVDAMMASPPDGTEARYARLRAEFSQLGCTPELMDEQAIARHPERNLLCILPGIHSDQIVVSAHYERRQNEEPNDSNWRGAVTLVLLYKALQAQPRHYTYVFAELSGEEGEKQFLGNLASRSTRGPGLRAAIALDLPVSGPWQYELSWNAFLMASHHPGDMSAAEARWQDTTSTGVVRTTALRADEAAKAILVASLMESANIAKADQPVHRKPSRGVESAQLFRHSTDIPAILIYSVPPQPEAISEVQTSADKTSRTTAFDFLADYLCRVDDNLALQSAYPRPNSPQ